MKRSRVLNVAMVIVAALAAMQLWMSLASQPVFAGESRAAGDPPGFPNAAKQRQDIVDAIKQLTAEVQKTNRLLESETLEVKVSNFSDMKSASAAE